MGVYRLPVSGTTQEDEKRVNHMSELYKKMVHEAMAAQRADVGMVKKT